jgi:hypothetical protein
VTAGASLFMILPMGESSDRAGFVRFQLDRARQALALGEQGAARAALRVLRAGDFAGIPLIVEALLEVIHESSSPPDEVAAAIAALVRMPVAERPPVPDQA